MDREILLKIKRRLERLGDKSIGETQTKESFINPLISALGWDVTDFEEVKLEYKHTKKDTPVDYALLIDMTPKLYIEAKQIGSNLDDYKWIAQILTYSTMAGVKWAILTDGNHYKLYNTTAEAKLEEKLFYEWRMKNLTETNVDRVINFLNLLTKEKFKDDEIERAWNNHFEVNKVRKALKTLIDDKDESLLKFINKKTKLGKAVIVNSLNKLKIKIEKVYAPDVFLPVTEIQKETPYKEGSEWTNAELISHLKDSKPYQRLFLAALMQVDREPIKSQEVVSLMNEIAKMRPSEEINRKITGRDIGGARAGFALRRKRLNKERLIIGEYSAEEKDHVYKIKDKYKQSIKDWVKAENLWIK